MKKNFKSSFEDLLTSTVPSQQSENTPNNSQYTRVTIAIRNDLLEKTRILCLKKKTKLRNVINDLIESFLEKENVD